MGRPVAAINPAATGCEGIRTPTVARPALTSSGISCDLSTIKVSGPGQKASINALALAVSPLVSGRISSLLAICKIKGLSAGRPFAAKIFATAAPFSPSAPRP